MEPNEAALSKLVFNAQHRLAVADVFIEDATALLQYEEVAERARVGRSVAHKELSVFVTIGAVNRLTPGRFVYYQRAESEFWSFCADLIRRSRARSVIG